MSDLSAFRDHARQMSTAEHKPECKGTPERVVARAREISGYRRMFGEDHPKLTPLDRCPGCITPEDRALWTRLADEADAYLSRNAEEGLFT
jgi:hypothetical protein